MLLMLTVRSIGPVVAMVSVTVKDTVKELLVS